VSEIERDVHARLPVVADKEVHVSTVYPPGEDAAELFAEIREYIPSTEAYGRGITFPLSMLHDAMEGLESIWFKHGAGAAGEPTDPGLEVEQ
jgi:hypothetical protein